MRTSFIGLPATQFIAVRMTLTTRRLLAFYRTPLTTSSDLHTGMSTNQSTRVQDKRQQIVEAGLAALREHGYAGFTQPRVAALAGLRQSHLTYYHPTRVDLLAAVGRAAVDRQLAAVKATLASLSSVEEAADAIAELVARRENTRVLMALAQAADEEPPLRELFRELADGIVAEVGGFLERLGVAGAGTEESARLLHALSVGLAVVSLATGRPDGTQRAAGVLTTALQLMGRAEPPRRPSRRGQPSRTPGEDS